MRPTRFVWSMPDSDNRVPLPSAKSQWITRSLRVLAFHCCEPCGDRHGRPVGRRHFFSWWVGILGSRHAALNSEVETPIYALGA